MKKLLLIFLIFAINPTLADWSKTLEIEDSIWYIDYSTIRKDGQLVKVWLLSDNIVDTKENSSYSMELLQEIDCKKGRKRNLAKVMFSGRMGSGKIIYRSNESHEWQHIRFHVNSHEVLISSLVCQGEWLKVFENPEAGSFYFDPLSIIH